MPKSRPCESYSACSLHICIFSSHNFFLEVRSYGIKLHDCYSTCLLYCSSCWKEHSWDL